MVLISVSFVFTCALWRSSFALLSACKLRLRSSALSSSRRRSNCRPFEFFSAIFSSKLALRRSSRAFSNRRRFSSMSALKSASREVSSRAASTSRSASEILVCNVD